MPLSPITDAARVGNRLAQSVDDLDAIDQASLEQACADATAIVLGYCRRADLDGLADFAVESAIEVATRVAARIYRNPREISSEGYNEMSVSYRDPRILTGDERSALSSAGVKSRVLGPIIQSGTVL